MEKDLKKDMYDPLGCFATLLYTDRKLVLFIISYFVSSFILYAHFSVKKFQMQFEIVPEDATRYWWKVLIPTFEFGTMHFILFNLALIPMTMCRFIITKASKTFLKSFVPFHETTKVHIALGYITTFLLVVSTITFVTFFGILCSDGQQSFCDKLTSEIMISGYIIFATFMIIGFTSYFRNMIPYKVFYICHHLFLLAYAATIAHTIDNIQRQQGGRSQTFQWLSASFILYMCDRAAMYLKRRYKTQMDLFHCRVRDKMIYLRVTKPSLFNFGPGQFVYLKIPLIDDRWHPFSIASSPSSPYLEFYIESSTVTSWTAKLRLLVKDLEDCEYIRTVKCEIMGPYGTNVDSTGFYSHVLLIGAGTGVVPILSNLKQHLHKCCTLRPAAYTEHVKDHHQRISTLIEARSRRNHSCYSHFSCTKARNCNLTEMSTEDTFQHTEEMIRHTKFTLYKFIPLLFFPPFGLLVLGLTFAWNSLAVKADYGMSSTLMYTTICFHLIFFIFTISIRGMNTILNYIDLVVVIISAILDSYWSYKSLWGSFTADHKVYFTIGTVYMIIRSWSSVLNYNIGPNPIEHSNKRRKDLVLPEHIRFVWTTRDTSAISLILPNLENIWNDLCNSCGIDFARQCCKISIHCTCNDELLIKDLEKEFEAFNLIREGALYFERPSIQNILNTECLNRIRDESLKASCTLLAFCGSSTLASTIKQYKILNDVALLMTGNLHHQVDLVIENFSGHVNVKKNEENNNDQDENSQASYNNCNKDKDQQGSIFLDVSPTNTVEFDCDENTIEFDCDERSM